MGNRKHLVLVAFALPFSLLAAPVVAQPRDICLGYEKASDDRIVAACLDLITGAMITGEAGSDVPQAYYNRGAAYERLGKYDRAQRDYARAYNSEPNFTEALLAYREVSVKLGQTDEVTAGLDAAVRASPGDSMVLNDACRVRASLGKELDVALADCNEALRIAPENYYVLASRCFVRFRTGDFANAVADCDAALKLKSDLPSALYIRGLAETRLGYADMGKADLAAAAALDPKTADTYAGYGVKP